MKTTMTAGKSCENGGRFAGGHFAGGHDGMANLCKPITAYDFHVRYNNTYHYELYSNLSEYVNTSDLKGCTYTSLFVLNNPHRYILI